MAMSWLDAGNLRHEVYHLSDRPEIAKLALDDMKRMDDLKRVKDLARRTLDKL